MKKAITFFAVALLGWQAWAQQPTEKISFEGKVEAAGVTNVESFKRLADWCWENMPEESIKHTDENIGELSGTWFVNIRSRVGAAKDLTDGFVIFDFKLLATENGFQYQLSNFRHEAKIKFHTLTTASAFPYKINTVEKPWYDMVWKDLKQQIATVLIPKTLETMKTAIEGTTQTARLEQDSVPHAEERNHK
jgi:hypothetical protein